MRRIIQIFLHENTFHSLSGDMIRRYELDETLSQVNISAHKISSIATMVQFMPKTYRGQ